MKVAILTNSRPNYSLALAEGLSRMLAQLGVSNCIFYDGLDMVYRPMFGPAHAKTSYRNLVANLRFLSRLRTCDLVVVVMTVPEAFYRSFDIEKLRRFLPRIPIVQYANLYAGNSQGGEWLQKLQMGVPNHPHPDLRRGNNPGLERYDWYLCSSVASATPLPRDARVSIIGIDLNDGTLFPEQDCEFLALIDFERPEYLQERAVQVLALEDTNTRYVVLNGNYSPAEIRQIYRRTSIYFLAFPESFGLPVCELQACGSLVFTPSTEWVSGHWIKDVHLSGSGCLTPNFVLYDNDPGQLARAIQQVKGAYNPCDVVETFVRFHPQFIHGNLVALQDFLDRVSSGGIRGKRQ